MELKRSAFIFTQIQRSQRFCSMNVTVPSPSCHRSVPWRSQVLIASLTDLCRKSFFLKFWSFWSKKTANVMTLTWLEFVTCRSFWSLIVLMASIRSWALYVIRLRTLDDLERLGTGWCGFICLSVDLCDVDEIHS